MIVRVVFFNEGVRNCRFEAMSGDDPESLSYGRAGT